MKKLYLGFLLILSTYLYATEDFPEPPESEMVAHRLILMVKPVNQQFCDVIFNWKDVQLKILIPVRNSEAFNIPLQLDNMLQAIENDFFEKLKKEILPHVKEKNVFIEIAEGEDDPSKESPYYQDHLKKIKKDILYAQGETHLNILENELQFIEYLRDFNFIPKEQYQSVSFDLNMRTQDVMNDIDAKLKEFNPNERNLFKFIYEEKDEDLSLEFEHVSKSSSTDEIPITKPSAFRKTSATVTNYLHSWKESFRKNKAEAGEGQNSPTQNIRERMEASKAYAVTLGSSTVAFGSRTFENMRSFWKRKRGGSNE